MPSNPGEEFTSRSSGPFFPLIISTPATLSPIVFVARRATLFSSGVILGVSDFLFDLAALKRAVNGFVSTDYNYNFNKIQS